MVNDDQSYFSAKISKHILYGRVVWDPLPECITWDELGCLNDNIPSPKVENEASFPNIFVLSSL